MNMDKYNSDSTDYSGLIYDGSAKVVVGDLSTPIKC